MIFYINVIRVSDETGETEKSLQGYFDKIPEGLKSKKVSFYFDSDHKESGFAFLASVAIPTTEIPFEFAVADLVDHLGDIFGVTNAKYDDQFLF